MTPLSFYYNEFKSKAAMLDSQGHSVPELDRLVLHLEDIVCNGMPENQHLSEQLMRVRQLEEKK